MMLRNFVFDPISAEVGPTTRYIDNRSHVPLDTLTGVATSLTTRDFRTRGMVWTANTTGIGTRWAKQRRLRFHTLISGNSAICEEAGVDSP
jgi:hypothetical protein